MSVIPRGPFEAGIDWRERLSLWSATLKSVVKAMRNRRQVYQLAELPDHLLADVGLKRDDVHAALSTDWREDPSYQVAAAARRRRMN